MPVGTINSAKDLRVTYQPLLLSIFEFSDASILRLSTHGLNTADGGYQFGGKDYLPRIGNQSIAAMQALSEQGIDIPPSVDIEILDADKYIWNNFELTKGFKGAVLTMIFAFWNVDQNDFSSDTLTRFVGTCSSAQVEGDSLRVTAVNKMNLNQAQIPLIRISKRSTTIMPTSARERQLGADNRDSWFYRCGYSPDADGSEARGNIFDVEDASFATPIEITLTDHLFRTNDRVSIHGVTGNTAANAYTAKITGATAATPISITATGHLLSTGATVDIRGVLGNTPANGTWTVTVTGANTFTLDTSIGSGTYVADTGEVVFRDGSWVITKTGDDTFTLNGSVGNAGYGGGGEIIAASCRYTKEHCSYLGMYSEDADERPTGRFSAVQWDPPDGHWKSRDFLEGKWIDGMNTSNEAKYNDVVPVLYGTSWTEGLVLNVVGDANATKMEVLVCGGDIGMNGVARVVVNDVELPYVLLPSDGGSLAQFNRLNRTQLWWTYVTTGGRDGKVNEDSFIYNSTGDPYGSMAVIECSMPRKFLDSSSIPRVSILATGPAIRVYTNPTTYTYTTSDNPVWIMADILVTYGGWEYADFNLQTWYDAAVICNQAIDYVNQFGQDGTHTRYIANLALRQKRTVADLLRALRSSCKSIIVPNNTGQLEIYIKQTLAEEQPSTINGSNYDTDVPSLTATGTAANGKVAYKFDESNIILEGGQSTLRVSQRPIQDTPNHVSLTFQDQENNYASDSLTVIDTVDVVRANQEVTGTAPVEGIPNFDQGRRIIAWWMAEAFRGNLRGDSGGTLRFEWKTTFKGVHLRIGHLCLLSFEQLGIEDQLVRIEQIQPATNFETVRFVASWHEDQWYLDKYGQEGEPIYEKRRHNRLQRAPFGWVPAMESSIGNGDDFVDPSDGLFSVQQTDRQLTDGSHQPIVQVAGVMPINTFAASAVFPPFVPLQGTTSDTGGFLLGGTTYHIILCARSEDYTIDSTTPWPAHSAPSAAINIDVATGTDTNTVTVSNLHWSPNTAGWTIWAGTDRNKLSFQGISEALPEWITITGDPLTPDTITIEGSPDLINQPTGLYKGLGPQPDIEFDHFVLKAKLVYHAGVWGFPVATTGAPVTGVHGGTITLGVPPTQEFATDIYAGRWISLIARSDMARVYVMSFKVLSNNENTLTLTEGSSDPTFFLTPNDVMVMRQQVTAVGSDDSGNYIEDDLSTNSVYPDGMTVDLEAGRQIRIIRGTGQGTVARIRSNTANRLYIEGQWVVVPDTTSLFIIEDVTWSWVAQTGSRDNSELQGLAYMDLILDNFNPNTSGTNIILIAAYLADGDGHETEDANTPTRDMYVFGAPESFTPATQGLTSTTDAVISTSNLVHVTTGGDIVLASTPSIQEPQFDGQTLRIVNVGAGTVTLQDETDLAGSKLSLGGTSVELETNHGMSLVYVQANDTWVPFNTPQAVSTPSEPGGTTTVCGYDPYDLSKAGFVEDFLTGTSVAGDVGSLGWWYDLVGFGYVQLDSSPSTNPYVTTNPGVVYIGTNNTSGSSVTLGTAGDEFQFIGHSFVIGDDTPGNWRLKIIAAVQIDESLDERANAWIDLGFGITTHMLFEKPSLGSTWHVWTGVNAGTDTDTGIAIDDLMHEFEFYSKTPKSLMGYSIDGVEVGTADYTGSSYGVSPRFYITQENDGADQRLYVDRVSLKFTDLERQGDFDPAADACGGGSTWDHEWTDDFLASAPISSVALVTSGSYRYGARTYGDKGWSFASITSAGAAGTGYGSNFDSHDGGRGPGYTVPIRKGHDGVLILGFNNATTIYLGEKAAAGTPTFGHLFNPLDGTWELHFWVRVGSDQDPSFGNTDCAMYGIATTDSNPPRGYVGLSNAGFTDNPGFSFFCVFSDGERTYFNSNYGTSIPSDTKIKFVNFIRSGGVEVVDTGVEAYNSGGVGEAYWRILVIRRKVADSANIYFQVYDEDGTDLSGELSSSFDPSSFDGTFSNNFDLVSPFISVNNAETMIDKVKFMHNFGD
jgi:hypothetical protein